MRKAGHRYAVALGLGVTQVVGWGSVLYFPAVMGHQIAQEIGIGLEVVFGGVSSMYVVGALIAPWAGRRIDRHGARPVMTLGSLVAAAGFLGLSLAQSRAHYLGAWLLLGGLCGGALSSAAYAAVSQAGHHHAGRGFAVLTFATGLAATVCLPAIHVLGAAHGWRAVALAAASLHLGVCAPLHWCVLPRRASPGAAAVKAVPMQAKKAATLSSGGAMPVPRGAFAALAVALSLNVFVTTGFALHLIGILTDLDVAPRTAIALISAIGPIQVGIRAVQIALADRIDPMASGLVGAAALPLGIALLLASGWALQTVGLAAAVGFVVLFALSNALMVLARAAVPHAVFGAAAFGRWTGRLGTPQNIASAVTPVAFAYALGTWNGRGALLLALAASLASLASIVALAMLRRA